MCGWKAVVFGHVHTLIGSDKKARSAFLLALIDACTWPLSKIISRSFWLRCDFFSNIFLNLLWLGILLIR